MQWLRQNVNETLNPQKTPHTLPLRVSYGVSLVLKLDKIDCIIMAPHCISLQATVVFGALSLNFYMLNPV